MESISEKASYCLSCVAKPCKQGCPLDNDITDFIKAVKEDDYKNAYKIATKTSVLQSVCGRICPHMSQCEGKCIRGIKQNPVCIGDIESSIGDKAIEENYDMCELEKIKGNHKVAIIGSGPAGLTCAAFLRRRGVNVTIYEKYDKLGGILRHGIPDFRLPKSILDKNIEKILSLGIDVLYGKELGVNLELDSLKKEYDAIFIAIGANVSWKMDIPGEELEGVFRRKRTFRKSKSSRLQR